MRAICVQPPFVQLNAPYPAVWYLDAWLRSRGVESFAVDHSIALARRLFGREGLTKVFADARAALVARKHPDPETARRANGYLEAEAEYLSIADSLLGFLSGGDPAFAYRLAVGAGVPLGMRAEAAMGDGIGPDDARAVATAILDDLSDFINYALDPGFGTVRYAERLAASAASFAPAVEAARNGWVMREVYRPLLRETFAAMTPARSGADRALVLLSIPFPGCLAGAIAAAEEARAALGDRALIVAGGGYVSTELRFLAEPAVFDAFDYLAYDAGFGALASIIDAEFGGEPGSAAGPEAKGGHEPALYRVRRRDRSSAKVLASGFAEDGTDALGIASAAAGPGGREPTAEAAEAQASDESAQASVDPAPASSDQKPSRGPGGSEPAHSRALEGYARLEAESIAKIHPDYRGLEPWSYLRVVDSPNPARRLWNDTPWLKYRLAYGCYWAKCAFCDTQLDYIKRYAPSDLDSLMTAADAAGARTGLYGIHFVDEAMPASLVRAFAARNAERPRPFTFWGNVRFDKAWTDEACAFASERGLVAVSGGIEIATGRGLDIVGKGLSLSGLVRTLASFKRRGILVHAYLIYGFPGQSDQDIADSAEMTRALVDEGLVDSAFWHKFVLTRHSRMYEEWRRGKRPTLEPIEPPTSFALNDLRFRGENESDRWTAPLDAALSAWVDEGEPRSPLSEFLPKGLPRPKIDAMAVLEEAGVIARARRR